MKQRTRRALALMLAACLLLSGCSGRIERATQNLRVYKLAKSSAEAVRPQPVGEGLDVVAMAHFPEGFQSKYPLAGDGVWEGDIKPIFDRLGGQSAYEKATKQYGKT